MRTRPWRSAVRVSTPRRTSPAERAVHPERAPFVNEGRDTHVKQEQSPVRIGIDSQMPNSMPRAEDDVITRAGSRDFHDQPGSGGNIARRWFFF